METKIVMSLLYIVQYEIWLVTSSEYIFEYRVLLLVLLTSDSTDDSWAVGSDKIDWKIHHRNGLYKRSTALTLFLRGVLDQKNRRLSEWKLDRESILPKNGATDRIYKLMIPQSTELLIIVLS